MKLSESRYHQKVLLGRQGNALITLIAICLVSFVLLAFLKAIWYFRFPKEEAPLLFTRNVMHWFVLPASFGELAQKPWTLITHMFVHDNVWRVFANMLWLWSFGYILRELTGDRKIIPVFIYGALAGALAFLASNSILPPAAGATPAVYTGASAAVVAIAIATTLISPNYRIFPMIGGGLPLWAFTALFLIIDLATVSITDTGSLMAHLFGGLMGAGFVLLLRNGYDWSDWMNNFFDWVSNLFNPDRPRKGANVKEELFYSSNVTPFVKTPHITQQRVDEILDKINQQGYGQLTGEEKEILRRASEEGF